jgi:hypothetical protein
MALHVRGDGSNCAAIVSGIPIPLLLLAVSFTRSGLASHVSGLSPSFATHAAGVGSPGVPSGPIGNAPPPVPSVAGSQSTRRYARPFTVVPDRGQFPKNGIEPVGNNGSDVLQHDVSGLNHANDSDEFVEQPRPGALFDAGLLAGGADVLAGEPTANNVS